MKKILTADGYKKNHQGFYAKHGKVIKFSIEDPIAYSDYYADAQLISSELKSEGIDATVYGVQASQWYTDSADGDFTSIDPLGQRWHQPVHAVRQLAGLHHLGADRQVGTRRLRSLPQRGGPGGLDQVGRDGPERHGGRGGGVVAP